MVTVGFPSLFVLRSLHGRSLLNFWSLGFKFKKNLSISPKTVDTAKSLTSLEKIFFNKNKRLRGEVHPPHSEVVFFSTMRWGKSLISLRKFCSFCEKNEGLCDNFGLHTYATEPPGIGSVCLLLGEFSSPNPSYSILEFALLVA